MNATNWRCMNRGSNVQVIPQILASAFVFFAPSGASMFTRIALLTLITSSLPAAEIRQFRGNNGDGIASETSAPLEFSLQKNLSWQTQIPGKGWSSPVIADGIIYLTTAIEVFPTEEEREELLKKAGDEPKVFSQRGIAKAITLKLLKIELKSGKLLDAVDLVHVEEPNSIHKTNSYASPTPVIDGAEIYCHFGTYGTFCLNRETLKEKWHRTIPLVHSVGPGSSPFIYEDLLVLICDGVDRQYVMALKKSNGETVWETDRPEMDAPDGDQKKSFDTPVAVTDRLGREQLICMGSQWIVAYEPHTGKEIWKVYHGKGFSVVPRPVIGHGMVYISTGFGKAQLWAIRIDGSGDVTETHVVWKEKRNIPTKPSPLLVEDRLYVINDTGIATCFDAIDGTTVWTKRIGGNYSASPLLVDGRIYVASHEGIITVIQPGDEYQVLAENDLKEQIMASPIALDDSLIIRTNERLARFADKHNKNETATTLLLKSE